MVVLTYIYNYCSSIGMNTKMLSEQGKFLDTANFWEHSTHTYTYTCARKLTLINQVLSLIIFPCQTKKC